MKNILRKKIAFFIIILLTLTVSTTVLASSYTTPMSFAHELTSASRYFDGQNIAFEATPITYPDPKYPKAKPQDSIYLVTLIRDNGGWPNSNDTIGTAILPRNSFGKAEWTNVGSGKYYIFFAKVKDRIIVDANDAKMYNF